MTRTSGSLFSKVVSLLVNVALLAQMVSPFGASAANPAWWSARGVIATNGSGQPLPADDYAATNIGQLKQIASKAYAELQANAPGGIGSTQSPSGTGYVLQQLVNGWNTPNVATDDFAAVNLGQLKTVAKPFYDWLIEIGYAYGYPWDYSSNPSDDYAIANIGQVKSVFSFDVAYSSAGGATWSALPDWWQTLYFGSAGAGSPGSDPTALAPNGDGLTLLQNYQQGINPLDFYNGVAPTVQIVGGNNQTGTVGQVLPEPLVVAVTDGQGNPMANAPVQFAVTVANGLLATSLGGTGAATQTAVTGSDGHAAVYLQLGSGLTGVNTVQATAESASVTFTATAAASLGAGAAGSLMLTSGGYSTGPFTIGVKADGSVWGWGNNTLGQLGNGGYVNSATPVQASGLPGIVAASAGEGFVLALDQFGSVWAWGDNSHGELGAGLYSAIGTPVQMTGLFNIAYVAAGSYHALAVDSSGNVWAWGSNSQGQLGDGGTTDSSVPGQVAGIGGVIAVAGGLDVSVAVKNDETVWAWGNGYGGTPVQVAGLSGIARISVAPDDSALALDASGNVWSWTPGSAPVQIAGLASVTMICGGVSGSGMAIDAAGNVWTWPGSGIAPQGVTGLAPATAVSMANGYSVALASNGNVYGWGTTALLGNLPQESTLRAIPIPSLTSVVAAASGAQHALAVRSDGTVWAWGSNASGQLGNGGAVDSTAPDLVPGVAASAVAGGASHSIAVAGDGSLYAWGSNLYGQLGTGDTSGSSQSSPVHLGAGGTFSSVAAGTYHSLAVDSSGNAWAWGANWYGQLGNGDSSGATQYAPVQVVWTGTPPILSTISAGDSHSLALDSSGNVWAWGANFSGQLGNGDTTGSAQHSPVQVSGISNIAAASAGTSHSLAVDNAGAVWAWGANWNGQLGNGDTSGATQYAPIQVPGLSSVIAVAAGSDYSLAIKSDGTAWAWGGNESGQFGNLTTTGSFTPVQVPWLGQAVKVFAGAASAMVLESGQTLAAWGNNASGQIGIGLDETQVIVPKPVLGLNLSADDVPTATVNGPADGTVVPVSSNQAIQATVNTGAPSGAAIAKVEFYQEGAKIGEAVSAPWQMSWTATASGAVHLSAVATDSLGAKSQRTVSVLNVIDDTHGDGLPNWWETEFLGALGNSASALAPNGDGLSLIANFLQWINPNDYYNGVLPNIQIVSGDAQNGPAGILLPLPLTVQVTSASTGAPLANAPVEFAAGSGGGQVTATTAGILASSVTTTTDANGMASAYFQPGGNSSTPTQNQMQASVSTGGQTASQTFTILGTPSGAPPAATGLTVVSDSSTSLLLNWTNTAASAGNAATGILIQQQNPDGTWTTIATLPPSTTAYEATGLTTGQNYTYRVVSVNAAGGSSTPNPPSTAGDSYSAANPSSSPQPGAPNPSPAPKLPLRYAVIKLGTVSPYKITNSGYVLSASTESYQFQVWHNGNTLILKPDSTNLYGSAWYPTDIDENGKVVGMEIVNPPGSFSSTRLATWAPGSKTPALTRPTFTVDPTGQAKPDYFGGGLGNYLPLISPSYVWTSVGITSPTSNLFLYDGYKGPDEVGDYISKSIGQT